MCVPIIILGCRWIIRMHLYLIIINLACDLENGWLSKKCTKTDCNDGHYTYGEDCDDNNLDSRDGCFNCKV